MASAVSLSEPGVLACAKRALFPDDGGGDPASGGSAGGDSAGGSYAVVDTQFAVEEWLAERSVPAGVRGELAPFNHVRVGSGYPDLVGARVLESEYLAVERVGAEPPLVVVEAKGYRASGGVDVERGVVQAYDRLAEANAAYVAAPARAISGNEMALARELNVGVLAVAEDGGVEPVVVPRVVGNRSVGEASAIRFQASAQGVAEKSFGLNHPKNYLGVPLALVHADETDDVLAERVVGATRDARRGAAFLGLVSAEPDGLELTPLGAEVVRFARDRYDSVERALGAFGAWQGSRERFCEHAPEWGLVTRRVVWAYPATQLLVTELQAMHDDGVREPSLVDLVEWLHVQHSTFAVELFVRGTEDARGRVLTDDGDLRRRALTDGGVFHAPTVFQLKAMLYHAGIVTERGAEPHRLDPETDVWRLRHPIDRHH